MKPRVNESAIPHPEKKVEFSGPNEAAIVLQKHVRGFLARKKYLIKPLKPRELARYKMFVVGNDPIIAGLEAYGMKEGQIGLIGTSGLRSVQIAAELSAKTSPKIIPKIIIVDNSYEVNQFWQSLKLLIQGSKSEASFLGILPLFLNANQILYRTISDIDISFLGYDFDAYPSQDIPSFFKQLFKRFGFDFIRATILNAVCIKQSWTDEATFKKIKNIVTFLNIDNLVAYPSNIAFCIDSKKIDSFLQSIALLKPKLIIQSNRCPKTGMPLKVFVSDNSDPHSLKTLLFSKTAGEVAGAPSRFFSEEKNSLSPKEKVSVAANNTPPLEEKRSCKNP